MRQYVLYAMAVIFPVSLSVWFLWLMGKSFAKIYDDWKLERELIQLEAESEAHREKKKQINTARLDNGCDHDFVNVGHGLPPNSCCKCGREQDKPQGPCDHIWRAKGGGSPTSSCERCGKIFSPHAETESLG